MNEPRNTDDLIGPDASLVNFEDLRRENGNVFWWASDLMKVIGYGNDWKSFGDAIKRATKALMALNIDVFDNIAKIHNEDGTEDYKLTRFASYLVVMNADPKKPKVATAQAYFVALTQQFELWIQAPDDVVRTVIREEIKAENVRFSGIAKSAGVEEYAHFQNAGYL